MQREISEKILQIMKEKRLSYSDLSRLTSISKSTLQRYVAKESSNVPINRLEQIAIALGVKASYLLGWSEAQSDKQSIKKMTLEEFSLEHNVSINEMGNVFEVFDLWRHEVGEFDFDLDEMYEIIEYAKFIKMKRGFKNG